MVAASKGYAAPTGLRPSPVGTGEGGRRPGEGCGDEHVVGYKALAPDGAAERGSVTRSGFNDLGEFE